MKKQHYYFAIFFLLTISSSCVKHIQRDGFLDYHFAANIYHFANFLDKPYMDIFPKESPIEASSNFASFSEHLLASQVRILSLANDEIFTQIGISNRNINELIKYYQNNSLAVYSSKDSCLFIIKPVDSLHSRQIYQDDCYIKKYPIPLFSQFDETLFSKKQIDTKYNLTEDFIICVMNAKNKVKYKSKDFTIGTYLPKKWKHGFSNGVAISKEQDFIIYWTLIW